MVRKIVMLGVAIVVVIFTVTSIARQWIGQRHHRAIPQTSRMMPRVASGAIKAGVKGWGAAFEKGGARS
jgi:hypothetical protein